MLIQYVSSSIHENQLAHTSLNPTCIINLMIPSKKQFKYFIEIIYYLSCNL